MLNCRYICFLLTLNYGLLFGLCWMGYIGYKFEPVPVSVLGKEKSLSVLDFAKNKNLDADFFLHLYFCSVL